MAEYTFPQIIQDDIKQFNQMFEPNLLSKTNLLNVISKYVFGNKGKQIRPAMTFLSARLFGDVTESTFSAAYMVYITKLVVIKLLFLFQQYHLLTNGIKSVENFIIRRYTK